jgi:hypothetical protein
VTINCTVDQEDLNSIAAALNAVQRENGLTAQQMQSFLQVTNTILGKILQKETSLASASSALRAQIARVARFQQEELMLLRGASPGGVTASSAGQSGGVNAGEISGSTINQNAQPASLSRFADTLASFFVEGKNLMNSFCTPDLSEDRINQSTNAWINKVVGWMNENMNRVAAVRFTDTQAWLSRGFNCGGKAVSTPANNAMNTLSALMENLRSIEETTLYDSK